MTTVSLFEICRPKQWKTIASKDLIASGYPVYGANGRIGYHSEYNHKEPTLLITCRGATCGSVLITEPTSYVNGNAMALDNLDLDKIHIKFLYYYLQQRGFTDVISGSAQPQITRQGLAKVQIPLRPLEDQQRIVSILDQANALRQKRKEAMKLLDEYVESVFLEMFGDPVTNSKGWRQMTLREVATTLKRGPFGGALKKDIFVPDGYAVYEQSHAIYGDFNEFRYFIPEEKYNEMKAFSVTPGDLIVSCSGTLGKIAEVPHDAKQGVINQALLRITLNNDIVLNAYFLFMFRSPWCQNILFGVSRGSGISNFPPMSVIKNLSFPIPDISYQKKFVSMNKDIVEIRSNMNMQKTELDLQFNALMQKAFSDTQ
ncbi:MAG: restriction endonuclease subunit S [Candidatus Peribacter sp.]|jgi:type I restriction enzyme S subunit